MSVGTGTFPPPDECGGGNGNCDTTLPITRFAVDVTFLSSPVPGLGVGVGVGVGDG